MTGVAGVLLIKILNLEGSDSMEVGQCDTIEDAILPRPRKRPSKQGTSLLGYKVEVFETQHIRQEGDVLARQPTMTIIQQCIDAFCCIPVMTEELSNQTKRQELSVRLEQEGPGDDSFEISVAFAAILGRRGEPITLNL